MSDYIFEDEVFVDKEIKKSIFGNYNKIIIPVLGNIICYWVNSQTKPTDIKFDEKELGIFFNDNYRVSFMDKFGEKLYFKYLSIFGINIELLIVDKFVLNFGIKGKSNIIIDKNLVSFFIRVLIIFWECCENEKDENNELFKFGVSLFFLILFRFGDEKYDYNKSKYDKMFRVFIVGKLLNKIVCKKFINYFKNNSFDLVKVVYNFIDNLDSKIRNECVIGTSLLYKFEDWVYLNKRIIINRKLGKRVVDKLDDSYLFGNVCCFILFYFYILFCFILFYYIYIWIIF